MYNYKFEFLSILYKHHISNIIQNKIQKGMVTCELDSACISKVFDGIVAIFLLPEADVFFKKLDDGFGISEGVFVDIINLLKCVGQSLLS